MIKLKKTPKLNKEELVEKIREKFMNLDDYMYQRKLFEFIDEKGNYLGDNFFETTFKFQNPKPPIVYEITGPYDSVSKSFAAVARVYYKSKLIFQYDHNDGIAQRTAAMTWLYIDALKHKVNNILIYGPGLISTNIADYLKYFNPGLKSIDYVHHSIPSELFEKNLNKFGVEANFVKEPDLSKYDTVIMATTTKKYCITKENIEQLKPNTVVVSLCTTSAIGEIEPEVYGLDNVQLFLDYELTRTFTVEMKKANKMGCIRNEVYLKDVIEGSNRVYLNQPVGDKVKIIRLTGTPMQNIAVIEMMLEREKIKM